MKKNTRQLFALIAVSYFAVQVTRETLANDIGKADAKFEVTAQQADLLLKKLKKDASQSIRRPSPDKVEINNGRSRPGEDTYKTLSLCRADEERFQEVQQKLLNPWMRAWKSKKIAEFNRLLIANAKIAPLATTFEEQPEKLDTISYYKNWNHIGKKTSVSDYLMQFKKIEDFDLTTFKYSVPSGFRDKNGNYLKAELHIQYDIRGITLNGEKRNDRGPILVSIERSGNRWQISEIKDWGIESLVNATPAFYDFTAESGIEKVLPEYRRLEAIRRGGYALALGDFDGDGIQDMYVGSFGAGKLLKGLGGGKFDLAKNTGLDNDDHVKSAVFADFNNDGLPDLLLSRFVPTVDVPTNAYHGDVLLYKNLGGGKFKKVESFISLRSPAENAMPLAVGDFNKDGLLDFYVGFPGSKDFTTFEKIPAREGVRAEGVYLNQGNLQFKERDIVQAISNKDEQRFNRIFPHSAVAVDFNQDGNTDIMVIDDRGNISPAYQNDGKGNFIQAQQYLGINVANFGMGMAIADIDNNGILDLVFSGVNFTNKYRVDASCKTNFNGVVYGEKDHGLQFYYGLNKGQFADATLKNGLFYAGEGLAGLEFLDYKNSGFQDLYVANGLWTGTDKEQDLADIFAKSSLADDERTLMEVKGETQSTVMKVLAGFKGDIFTGKQGSRRPHLAGFQRNRLFRNKGDGTFIEVGYVEGVDSIADGYIIGKADLNNDGSLDLVLRNADPGTKDVRNPPVQIFLNRKKGNSLRIKLLAKGSGSPAFGSNVTVTTAETKQYQQFIVNNGAAQSESVLHFGLGPSKYATKVVVTWPNQKQTVLNNVQAGEITIRESENIISAN